MNRFVEENNQLPEALRSLVAYYKTAEGRERLGLWARLAADRASIQFAGMGTSEFTSELFAFRLSARGRLSRSFDAGELFYQEIGKPSGDALFVLTSQSGESVEIRNLASRDWFKGYVAVVNGEDSSLARGSILCLPLKAGREDTITTKTYSNNVALFRLLEARLDGEPQATRMLDSLSAAANAMEELDGEGIESAAELLFSGNKLPFLAFSGRGDAVVSARQCGLTFMEGLKRPAAAYAGGAFRHGPFESVGPGLGLVLFCYSAQTEKLAAAMANDAADKGSAVVMIVACGSAQAVPVRGAGNIRAIRVPAPVGVDPGLFPLLAARSHNALLHALASKLGIETGIFRYGGKITSKE